LLIGAGTLATLVVIGSAVVTLGADATQGTASTSTSPAPTALVTRRDLVERIEYDGTLGYGDPSQIAVDGNGTITALPAVGSIVDRGQSIAEVDGRPVVVFFGDRPLWRPLASGADDGPDIEEIERNLIALGYGPDAQLGPDQHWSAATTAAVKRWQKALGVDETGRIDPSVLVMRSGPLRISKHLVEPGAHAGAPVVEATGTTQLVSVDLPAARQSSVSAGDEVQVTLADGSAANGTVWNVGSVATAQQGGDPTVAVTVVLAQGVTGAGLDESPVKVGVTTTAAEGVLAVPVEALLALSEGGYAVERPDGSLVAVQLGAFADGWVEVTADLDEGDEIVTAP
jgi:peptidoglycan hydrolase-like protein with peptidoglycan-binding domain